MQKSKILVLDNNINFLNYLTNIFIKEDVNNEFNLIKFNDPNDAIQEILKEEFHIIIVDFLVYTAYLNVIDICKLIKNSYINSSSHIIALIPESNKEKKSNTYNLSFFDDFIDKPSIEANSLINKLKALVKCNSNQKFIIKKKDYKYTLNEKEIPLTNTEFGILKIISDGKNEYYSSLDVCELINEKNLNEINNPSTIRVHIKNIRKKINNVIGIDFITTISKKGYSIHNVSIMDFDS